MMPTSSDGVEKLVVTHLLHLPDLKQTDFKKCAP